MTHPAQARANANRSANRSATPPSMRAQRGRPALRRWLSVLAATTSVAAAAPSQAAVVTFEDLAIPVNSTTGPLPSQWSYGSFFNSSDNHLHLSHQDAGMADSGSTWLIVHDNFQPSKNVLTMTAGGGCGFTLSDAAFAETFAIGDPRAVRNANKIDVLATFCAGSPVSMMIMLDGINDGPGGVADFQTVNFGWTNLASVRFTGYGGTESNWGLDQIKAQTHPVPEPQGLALLGLGLLGLAGLRQRRSSARSGLSG